MSKPGILLCNLGTPDSPSTADVRRYLAEFLWDPRVIKLSRPLWWLILNLVILTTRPSKSAKAYAKVWTDEGSPLLSISKKQCKALQSVMKDIPVELGMRYGSPSTLQAMEQLAQKGVTQFVVLSLYPQFSHTTVSSVEDEVARIVNKWNKEAPSQNYSFSLVHDYHDNHTYIEALADSVTEYQKSHGVPQKLLLSFHGIPQEYADDGDPYPQQCKRTANLLAEKLNLNEDQWQLTFQSRLGPKQWLQPYTDKTLESWGQSGIESVQVICPGFSVDCLETLEEVAMENKEIFLENGGKNYSYIPCLNEHPSHIEMMHELIRKQLP
jgi:ferrochelatase